MYSAIYSVLCLAIVAVCIRPLGLYIARIPTRATKSVAGKSRWVGWSAAIYKLCGINSKEEMGWRGYAMAILMFGMFGALLFILFVGQGALPLNPQNFPGLPAGLAFNAAISFVTNTNWQSYSGESTLSYLSQMTGCAVQNFLSAATGMAVAVALFRGLVRKKTDMLGNAYDMDRSVLYILLPMAAVFALFLVTQGVIQISNLMWPMGTIDGGQGTGDGNTVQPSTVNRPLIPMGPVASQVAIKMLGSNGGGFFLTLTVPIRLKIRRRFPTCCKSLAILLIPGGAFAYTFGVLVGDRRQGWMLLAGDGDYFHTADGDRTCGNRRQPAPIHALTRTSNRQFRR